MSDKTKIEWSDATWNPVTGCSKVSEGCRNCYAMTFAERWRGTPGHYFENGFDITLRPDKLDKPLRWKRPRKIFVNSMSDLFHADVGDDFIAEVFAVMSRAPQHTFQVLTKRPERMRSLLNSGLFWIQVNAARFGRGVSVLPGSGPILLPNVWIGVSVENQKAADKRIPLLLQTPAAVRFLSCEPLLGPVDLSRWMACEAVYGTCDWGNCDEISTAYAFDQVCGWLPVCKNHLPLHQVIAGGESGPGARPMRPDWARSLRDQCQAAGVPFFFKQWGEHLYHSAIWYQTREEVQRMQPILSQAIRSGNQFPAYSPYGTESLYKVGKKKAGRLLDGRTWDEFPGEA